MDYLNKSLKGAMQTANDVNAKIVLILDYHELKKKVISIKDMANGTQKEVAIENLIGELKC